MFTPSSAIRRASSPHAPGRFSTPETSTCDGDVLHENVDLTELAGAKRPLDVDPHPAERLTDRGIDARPILEPGHGQILGHGCLPLREL